MDTMKFWLKVLIMDYVFAMCLDLQCNWKTQYRHEQMCCDSCPQGEYAVNPCNASMGTVCKKCPTKDSDITRCSCRNENLCSNSNCKTCVLRPKCKMGERLERVGNYEFNYLCRPCPNMTYNDEEDSTCKLITDCIKLGLLVLSAGSKTHNARCGCLADKNQLTPSIMVAWLSICSLICVALVINFCYQKITERRLKTRKSKFHVPRHSLVLKNDEPGYKLSKEEKGEMSTSHGYSDISSELSAEEKSLEV